MGFLGCRPGGRLLLQRRLTHGSEAWWCDASGGLGRRCQRGGPASRAVCAMTTTAALNSSPGLCAGTTSRRGTWRFVGCNMTQTTPPRLGPWALQWPRPPAERQATRHLGASPVPTNVSGHSCRSPAQSAVMALVQAEHAQRRGQVQPRMWQAPHAESCSILATIRRGPGAR